MTSIIDLLQDVSFFRAGRGRIFASQEPWRPNSRSSWQIPLLLHYRQQNQPERAKDIRTRDCVSEATLIELGTHGLQNNVTSQREGDSVYHL